MLGLYGSLSQNGCAGLEYLQLPQQCLYFCVCGVFVVTCVCGYMCVCASIRACVHVVEGRRGSQKKPTEGGEVHFIMKRLHSLFTSEAPRS